MHDVEIVRAQDFPPAYLTSIKFFGGCKVDEVLMVSIDSNSVSSSFNILSPFLTHDDNSHKFLIMYLVIQFSRTEFA